MLAVTIPNFWAGVGATVLAELAIAIVIIAVILARSSSSPTQDDQQQ